MKNLAHLLLACIASVAIYFVLFGFVVSRPLVVDLTGDLMNKKLAYAAGARSPKMFVIAGSNGRFSHSCAVLEKALSRPCVNLGMTADVGLDWITDKAEPYMKPGDLVYLPLEHSFYAKSRTAIFTGSDAAYRFRHDKASLASRGAIGALRGAFMFDVGTLVQSVGEMGLQAAGIHRRSGVAVVNAQGDEIETGDAQARLYEDTIRNWPFDRPSLAELDASPGGAQFMLGQFLDWCRAHGVKCVGGLPTIFDDKPVPDEVIAGLARFYRSHGAEFVVLANRSQYPRAAFFDTSDHLREQWQARHSELLAEALRPLLGAGDAK